MVEATLHGGLYGGTGRWIDQDAETLRELRITHYRLATDGACVHYVYQPRRVAGHYVELADGSIAFDYVGQEL